MQVVFRQVHYLCAMFLCSNCQTMLRDEARFCSNCGQPQLPVSESVSKDVFRWADDPVAQAYERLCKRLNERVEQEQDEKKTTVYQERIYESGYRDLLQRRFEQWAALLKPSPDKHTKKKQLNELKLLTDDLLDFFFIIHCTDLNRVVLNEAILRYQNTNPSAVDLHQMALNFLHFDYEDERLYTDFISLPVKKLKNAAQQFLFPEKDEQIWFICDQSLLGNAKEGFAMTEKALYWKSGLQAAQRIYYHKITSLKKENDWLLINDLFFNATPSLNTKMIWLLRKLLRFTEA